MNIIPFLLIFFRGKDKRPNVFIAIAVFFRCDKHCRTSTIVFQRMFLCFFFCFCCAVCLILFKIFLWQIFLFVFSFFLIPDIILRLFGKRNGKYSRNIFDRIKFYRRRKFLFPIFWNCRTDVTADHLHIFFFKIDHAVRIYSIIVDFLWAVCLLCHPVKFFLRQW